jgi:K+/H+ antiporter YhaU regulatory subunit KhtT
MLRTSAELPIKTSDIATALGSASTETLFVGESSPAIGKTLGELDLRKKTKATVIAAIRDGFTEINPGPDFRFSANDIIVLLGSPTEIERAIEYLDNNPVV